MFLIVPSHKMLLKSIFLVLIITFGAKRVSAQENQLKWKSFEEALEIAKETKKPVMIDVWAPWCGWCKKMREEVYPELKDKIAKSFVLTRINRDDNETKKRYKKNSYTPLRLAQKLKVDVVPGIIFLNSDGEYMAHITGYNDAEKLNKILEIVLK